MAFSYVNLLVNLLTQLFSLLLQLLSYLVTAPVYIFNSIVMYWAQALSDSFGVLTPVVWVVVLALTGVALLVVVQTSQEITSIANPMEDV